MVDVEVVYVTAEKKVLHFSLQLQEGATVQQAVEKTGIYQTHPETVSLDVGIYAKLVPLTTPLKTGDRVEIYRGLTLDPKEKRRQLAKQRKA